MSYDVMRTVRQLIGSGVGDIARLNYILDRLENGKYIYLADQRYLESLLDTNRNTLDRLSAEEPLTVVNVEKDLREINSRLEKILQDKTRNEKKITDSVGVKHLDSPPKIHQNNREKTVCPKSEDTTLLFSVVLDLISLQGIGHIYNQKIVKGIALLVLSLSISTFT